MHNFVWTQFMNTRTNKVKVKVFMCLNKYHDMKTYVGVEV
jgi:hypothetical protein